MFKLQTKLMHFQYNSMHNFGPMNITWYKFDENISDKESLCLTQKELDDLTHYVANNKMNFANQNYFVCDPDISPSWIIDDSFPFKIPKKFILRKKPKISNESGNILQCMDIELLDENGSLNHTYNLNFDIIGEIDYL